MPKFIVPITRNCTETTNVDVEADTVEEAVEKALDEVRDDSTAFDFVYDDGSGGCDDPYFAGDDDYDAVECVDDDLDLANQKHNAQMLDGCADDDEFNAEMRHQTQGR